MFSKAPDADYEDSLLLEQYQAPITAALTPAFSSDSTPEILSAAVQVCAVFVGSGIVKDIGRMGRILKLLTSALEQSKGQPLVFFFTLLVHDICRNWNVIFGRFRGTEPERFSDVEDIHIVGLG